jgi:hypothetical protein
LLIEYHVEGPQISDTLKDFGSNSDSFFNDAMTTILEGVNAVAGAISSDAEGSTLARGPSFLSCVTPEVKSPETGVKLLADVTSGRSK